jgi:hypothetical protein
MKTSSTTFVAILTIAGFTLTGAHALAKGGNHGGNHSFTNSMKSSNMSSKFSSNKLSSNKFNSSKLNSNKLSASTFKLNNSNKNTSSSHSHISTLSSKKPNFNQLFKKQGNHNTSLNNISLNKKSSPKIDKLFEKKSDKKIDFFCKDKNHCKKDKCFDWCYPWHFGCYPSYGCYDYSYDYCYPTYACSYSSSIPVVQVAEPTRVRVVLGSVIMLNGQSFGPQPGGVRLRVSGMILPIQVVEWTPNAVKAQLPQIELTGVTLADIEVVRPDGSLASTTPVELASPQPLAFNR